MDGAAGVSEKAVGAVVRAGGQGPGAPLATPGEGGPAQPLGNLVEATPAVFAGAVFALFGLGLLVWTAVRARHRRPVYEGAAPGRSATVAASVAVASLALGLWCFSRV
ncbi:hypothetical protein ACGILS_06255 [Streptomyces albidoflavus]|uniref:hypothetical protein n=1 Tax=Streptomyces albidoflavus TaxID=1886 RepID=UPI00101E4A6F|nr:hypothetical protein [Streptomyces albidoflavus]MCU7704967.1 hypothetical protein [Streptomyces albidoflavus]RZD79641.1 hypothetical protein C0Q61_13850 [Streptomyces albidoflavus]RZD81047.1 hypothetical protein C0Q60_14795 [Streptomyces albidoflavus]RZD87064.1 hypothetical protein C0Q63_14225 [Streptomyces albidoflavus]RZD98616.1 hypothetical protein C0Q62_14675 [Streptomyces albidoflavus]